MAYTLSLFAQDITVSKDSLWVYNSIVSSKADEVIFTSDSSAPITLDSARIVVDEIDTTGLPAGQRMEAAWSTNPAMNPFFIWYLENAGNNEYLLKKGAFLPSGVEMPLTFEKNGDSSRIFKFSFGYCLLPDCRPLYPLFFRGTLKLFFSNSQAIELRLYSDDLRKKASTSPRHGSITVSQVLKFTLFDLKGRQLYEWECDGRLGEGNVPVNALKMPYSTIILHVKKYNKAETGGKSYVIVPR
jgi:hypothetical protein